MATTTTGGLLSLSKALRNATIPQIITGVVVLLFVRFIARGIYRVYFHPLRKFPGPKLSAFTRIPQSLSLCNGTFHHRLAKLHEEYGEVVRFSPDQLSFIHPQAWKDIYGYGSKEGAGSPPPKDWAWYGLPPNGQRSMVNEPSPAEHGRVRRVFSSAFSDRGLKQQQPLFLRYTNQLVQVMSDMINKNPDGKLDMVSLLNFTTFDIMGDLTFGEPLHMLDKNEYDPWVSIIFASIKVTSWIGILRLYPVTKFLLNALLGSKMNKRSLAHFNHSATRVTKRLEKGRETEGVDIWDRVLHLDESKGLSRKAMDSNASLFMVAGTETTATLLSGMTYYLLKCDDVRKKFLDELRGAFPSSDQINMEALATLPYFNACIKEALRRYPPVPNGLPHMTPDDGSTICGYYVPPRTKVTAAHITMYTSPRYFKDPLEFHPERWTGDERYANDERAAVQPFSFGARDCLGKNLALHEMRLVAAKLWYNFDLELCPESKDWDKQRMFTLWEKPDLLVRAKPAARS